jgi:hypothetical protein
MICDDVQKDSQEEQSSPNGNAQFQIRSQEQEAANHVIYLVKGNPPLTGF